MSCTPKRTIGYSALASDTPSSSTFRPVRPVLSCPVMSCPVRRPVEQTEACPPRYRRRHTEETEDGGSRLALDGEDERSEFVSVFVMLVGAVERNKRCCMALTCALQLGWTSSARLCSLCLCPDGCRHQRLEKLQQLRWEIGKVIPAEQKQVRPYTAARAALRSLAPSFPRHLAATCPPICSCAARRSRNMHRSTTRPWTGI